MKNKTNDDTSTIVYQKAIDNKCNETENFGMPNCQFKNYVYNWIEIAIENQEIVDDELKVDY